MTFRHYLSASASISATLLAAQAATINIDIQGDVANTPGWYGTQGTFTGQGVPTTGTVWNGVKAGYFEVGGPLVDDAGTATSISIYSEITVDGGAWSYAGAGNGGDQLMTDYGFHNSGDPNLFTLFTPSSATSGLQLTVGSAWDIYIYSQGDTLGQGGTFTLTQTSGDVTLVSLGNQINAGVWNGTLVEGGDYVVFRNVTPTSYAGGLEFKFLMDGNDAGGAGASVINGIQLVQVPEPSATIALLSSVGILALSRRRR